MRHYAAVLACLFVLLGAGCTSDQILRIRSLTGTTTVEDRNDNNGAFLGIDGVRRFTKADNINVLFVHGIGWTQKKSDALNDGQFGRDLAEALARAYDVKNFDWNMLPNLCPQSSLDVAKQAEEKKKLGNVLTVSASAIHGPYVTDDLRTSVEIYDLGCLDRIEIKPERGPSITLYRFFWDDALWDSIEWPHTRADGPMPTRDGKPLPHPGIDYFNDLRTEKNAAIKNSVITWGLMDAAAYLGPAGSAAREGVEGALCAVINTPNTITSGATRNTKNPDDLHMRRTVADLCATDPLKPEPLVVLAHSLGSRVVFDVLVTDLTSSLKNKIDNLPQESLEIHLLANQIPLLGVGRISKMRSNEQRLSRKPTFIAYSEVNDLLTYELVPYFEQLYFARCLVRNKGEFSRNSEACSQDFQTDFNKRTTSLNRDTRKMLSNDLGFDVVDVRAQFAKVIPIIGLADPEDAHSKHISESKKIRSLLLCGYDNTNPPVAREGCIARP